MCDLAGARAHIGEDDRSTFCQMVDEGVEAGSGMNVDLCDRSVEVVLQAAASFVFCVEVQKLDWDLVILEPFGESENKTGFADSSFSAHGEDDAFGDVSWVSANRRCCVQRVQLRWAGA